MRSSALAVAALLLLAAVGPIRADDPVDEDAPTDEEMEGINNIVEDTVIVKAIKDQAKDHGERLDAMSERCESEIKST